MNPSRRPRFSISLAVILILAAVLPAAAFTYTYPLSSTDIRDAYFIGRRNDESTAAFLVKYTRHFDPPASGPYISDVGIDTPFTQIAMHAASTANYDAPTAVQEFQDRPMKFYAHVIIALTATYQLTPSNPANSLYPEYPNFWKDFKVKLVQDRTIRPLSRSGGFLYNNSGDGYNPVPTGARVDLQYAPEKIDAAPIVVAVDAPDGQHVEATFDLATLR
ncbi:MAG: hypothetical protein WA209_18140 [Candidatus Acidiferrales bacterium]